MRVAIDRAAGVLRQTLPVFTRGNLFHAVARSSPVTRDAFDAALDRRLVRGWLMGLVATKRRGRSPRMRKEERAAYYPAAILLVDRPEMVDLFAASGALIQARVAVVDVQGHPRDVVRWLVAGARAGRRAPVGYLHDARTVIYPFAFEPLASLVEADPQLPFRDLGFRPDKGFRDPHSRKRVFDLEAATPAALVAYALRAVIDLIEPDMMLAPRRERAARG